jgi:hypothetical protein
MACMRAALLSACFASLVSVGVVTITPWLTVGVVLAAVASSLWLLWLGHVLAFATRATRCRLATATFDRGGRVASYDRRNAFGLFASAFALVAVATLAPALARAQSGGQCDGDTPYSCGSKWCCHVASTYHCTGYTGSNADWRAQGHFCVQETTDEEIADLRSNCAVLESC